MIQEPISDLQKILGEPVDEVTGEHLAVPGPAGKWYRDSRQEQSGRAPSLRPRLTVRLVALNAETTTAPGLERETGRVPVHTHPTDGLAAGVPAQANSTDELTGVPVAATPTDELAAEEAPLHEVPARVFVADPFLEDREVGVAPTFSESYTPEPDANFLTPEPQGNDYAEDDEDNDADTGEFYPYQDTPTPEPDVNGGPYTPAPDNNNWLYQSSKLHINRVSLADSVQPILLPMQSVAVESVSTGLTPAPTHAAKRQLRFDPALTLLTFLLLLGILGGIGFGYLLTIIYQG